MRAKYLEIVRLIEERVVAGDYAVSGVPSERKIATEFGVGHMTARRAVQQLIQTGTLRRPSVVKRTARSPRVIKRQLRVSLVLPAFESAQLSSWYAALNRTVSERDGLLRTVAYTHNADPSIHRELQSDFGAMFIVPPQQPSSLLLDALVKRRDRLVTLWHDYTHLGLARVDVTPPTAPEMIVEHLASLGHKQIDYFNTEPASSQITLRQEVWRAALANRGLGGDVHDYPVEPFEQASMAALSVTRKLLAESKIEATAMLCTSAGSAVAAIRACHEAGIRVGRDISIATIGGMAMTTICTPTITTVKPADSTTYLNRGLDLMLQGMPTDAASLQVIPERVDLWIGESTGPAPH